MGGHKEQLEAWDHYFYVPFFRGEGEVGEGGGGGKACSKAGQSSNVNISQLKTMFQ